MKNIIKYFLTVVLFALTLNASEKLSAYLIAKAQDKEVVKSNLQGYGFEILSSYSPYPGKTVITVTNNELKQTGTFMAAINILVSANEIRVQNPEYLGAAYLGKSYSKGQFQNSVNMLNGALGKMKNSKEALKLSSLKHYHFMFGMPYFEDMITVSNAPKQPKSALYKLKLPNGNILVGHRLKNNDFLQRIKQTKNASLLPYQSMVTSSKVVMLHPKFYLALELPLLKMGNFMTISDAPSKIEDEIKSAYK